MTVRAKRLDIQSLTIANLKPDTIVRSGAAGWSFVTPFGTVTLTGDSLLVVKSVQQDRPCTLPCRWCTYHPDKQKLQRYRDCQDTCLIL
ncbi:MAG: hypothetical protein LKE40_01335 [Spirochaetia bacterium]|nr:hypothetical protein [Spirochaetia bacterium]